MVFLYAGILFAQHPVYKHYTVEDGLPSSEVYDIIQDTKGYIWFATDRGVSRFDGYRFEVFTTDDGLSDNTVFEIKEDHRGRLWFRTFSGRLSYFQHDSIHQLPVNDELQQKLGPVLVNSIYVDEGDTIWLGLVRGMGKILPNHQIILDRGHESNAYYGYLKNIDEKGFITGSGRLKIPEGIKKITEEIALGNNTVFVIRYNGLSGKIFADKLQGDRYLFAVGNSLFHLADSTLSATISFDQPITHIKGDKQQNIWVGLLKGGVRYFRKGELSDKTGRTLLAGKSVSAVWEDREGSLWFATLEDGVYFLPSRNFLSYTTANGLDDKRATHITLTSENKVWLGMYNGTVHQIDGQSIRSFRFSQEENFIAGLFTLNNGKVWISTATENFIMNSKGASKKIDNNGGIFSLYQANDSIIWVGSTGGIMKYVHDKDVYRSSRDQDWKLRVNALSGNEQNELLVGCLDGLWVYKDDTFHYQGSKHHLLKNRITDIKKIDGRFGIATQGAGILIKEQENIYQITQKDGLTSNLCNSIFVENDSTIWVSTNNGLSIIGLKENIDGYTIRNITAADGLVSNEVNQIYVKGGKVWVATNKGLTIFDQHQLAHNITPPPIYIIRLNINGQRETVNDEYILPYDQNNLNIDYLGLSYKNAGELQYRYKMVGIDTNWVYTTARSVQYPTLPSGTYKFMVSARNNDGYWSKAPETLSFIIRPPFWQTWWFRALVSLIIVGSIYVFFKIRVLTYNRDVVRELIKLIIHKLKGRQHLYIKVVEGDYARIMLEDILWLKAAGDYVEIVTESKKYLVRATMQALKENIPDKKNFLRVHRSYIIPMRKIEAFQGNNLLINGTKIPVGDTYQKQIKALKAKIITPQKNKPG